MSYKHVVLADLKETFGRMIGVTGIELKCIPNYVSYTWGFLHGMQYHVSNPRIATDLLEEDKRAIVQEVTNILSNSSESGMEYEKEHEIDCKMLINQIISLKIACYLLRQEVREKFEKMDGYRYPGGKYECISNHATYTWGFLHGMKYDRTFPYIWVNLSNEERRDIPRDVVKMMSEAFYFTFGTSEDFPFHEGYIVIYSTDISTACEKFKRLYPNDKNPQVLNCSEVYSKEEWEKLESFKGKEPIKELSAFEC